MTRGRVSLLAIKQLVAHSAVDLFHARATRLHVRIGRVFEDQGRTAHIYREMEEKRVLLKYTFRRMILENCMMKSDSDLH